MARTDRPVRGTPSRKRARRKRQLGSCLIIRVRRARRQFRRRRMILYPFWLVVIATAITLHGALVKLTTMLVKSMVPPSTAEPSFPKASTSHSDRAKVVSSMPSSEVLAADTGAGRQGVARLAYLPPLSVGDVAVARALDYLIRNNGGRPGSMTEARWRTVDASSLALGVYLRDVDHQAAWWSLRREITTARLHGMKPVSNRNRDLDREKLSKLSQLAAAWRARGTELLSAANEQPELHASPIVAPESETVVRDALMP